MPDRVLQANSQRLRLAKHNHFQRPNQGIPTYRKPLAIRTVKNIQFSYFIEEGNETWDGRDANPLVEVTMKVKGDYQESNSYLLVEPLVHLRLN